MGWGLCAVALPSSDGLSSALIALVQSNLESAGLDRAQVFYASSSGGAAPTPAGMLQELIHACSIPLSAAVSAVAAASSDASPPSVSSPAFPLSLASTRLPRILLLAPSAKHGFNLELHRGILALDAHTQRLESNKSWAHCYRNPANAAAPGEAEAKRQSKTAAPASTLAPAALSPMLHAPVLPRDSSVFGLDLIAPVLLEYVLHRSGVSRVWSDMHRLQAEIETPGRERANAENATPQDQTLMLSNYPDPESTPSHSLAAHTFAVQHTRIFTALSVHKLQSIVLLHIELAEDTEQAASEATKATAADQTASGAGKAAAAAPLSRAERSAHDAATISQAIASLAALRVLSAFSSPRVVAFDDSEAGRRLAGMILQQAPQFGFRPVFLPFHRRMDLYAFCIGEGNGNSSSGAFPLASDLILCGSRTDLAPLLSLLLNGGRRHHVRLSAPVVSAAWDKHGPAIEVQHMVPEIPTACLRDSLLTADGETADGETGAEESSEQMYSSRYHGSRVLNGSFVPLAAAVQSDAS